MNINAGMIIITCLALALLISIPASAAENPSTVTSNEIAIRQAHLSWVALVSDVQMNAAINYVNTLFSTNTANMTSLLSTYRTTETRIPQATTLSDLNNVTADLRTIVGQFRNEMKTQMMIGQGKTDKLNNQLSAATDKNPYIQDKINTYWITRTNGQLGDFDADVQNAQAIIDSLNQKGYTTTVPQRTLDVIEAKRPDLKTGLDLKNEVGIQTALDGIFQLSQQLVHQVTDVQGQVPKNMKIQFLADQAGRAALRGDTINKELRAVILDAGPEESTVSQMKIDIAGTRALLRSGKTDLASTSLVFIKKDLKDLAQEYRDIANSANLPPGMSDTMKFMALALDDSADQTEVS